MLGLWPDQAGPRRVLCLGAHSDDIEIGCAGTVLRLLRGPAPVHVHWVVFGAQGARATEAEASAAALLAGATETTIAVHSFRDGFFPFEGALIKETFEGLKALPHPDLILTHYRDDRHQDHRLISDLTWNTFRDHLILEYEIPKWDGDLGTPNCYVSLDASLLQRKAAHLLRHFPSQAGRAWFTADTFLALARLRGVECNAPGGYAEAFYGRKIALAF